MSEARIGATGRWLAIYKSASLDRPPKIIAQMYKESYIEKRPNNMCVNWLWIETKVNLKLFKLNAIRVTMTKVHRVMEYQQLQDGAKISIL